MITTARQAARRLAMRRRITVANPTAYRTLMAVDHVHVQAEIRWLVANGPWVHSRITLTDRLGDGLADGDVMLAVDLLSRDHEEIHETAIEILTDHLLKIGA